MQRFVSALSAAWTAAAICITATGSVHAESTQPLNVQVNTALGLERSELVKPEVRQIGNSRWAADVTIDGQQYALDLSTHSVRGPGYQLLEAQPDGSLIPVEPAPVRTVRGTIAGMPNARVAGSLIGHELHALIVWPDGRRTWVEPLGRLVDGAEAGMHVVYDTCDVLPTGKTCGNEARHDIAAGEGEVDQPPHRMALRMIEQNIGSGISAPSGRAMPGGLAQGTLAGSNCQTELAIDSDQQYFDIFGSAAEVGARVAQVINTMNLQYEDEVGISHIITAVIVRPTAGSDPYVANTTGALLDEMTDLWETDSSLTSIPRDIAHLFTGRETGGVIGTAWVPGTCNNGFTYGVSQVEYNGVFSCATDLVAHEIGHNWNAPHCNCTGTTMHPTIQCANTFAATSITSITNYRDNIAGSCLNCDGSFPNGCGSPGAGNCFESNGSPYCNNADCCAAVCADDPFCCESNWDGLCAGFASELCGDCGDPGAGDCFVSNGTPGCENAECCELVCADDPFCCENNWDGLCADAAVEVCAGCGGPLAGGCYSENGSPGCTDETCCNDVCAVDSFCCNNTWDNLCANQAAEICGNCGDAGAGSCFEDNGSPGCNNAECCATVCADYPFCCETNWDSLCASTAESMCASCGGVAAGSCFESNGTPSCNNAECCNAVCDVDPFCCDTSWDSQCASQAEDICASCGGAAAGSCFEPNATAGCNDQACCDAVCAVDSFCCDVNWDLTCANQADDICASCGGVAAGSCFESNGTPACNNDGCCQAVCDVDPFCCDVSWDSQCAGEGQDICASCGGVAAGSCFESNGTPSCNNDACCQAVCDVDPFCCNTSWDATCASQAEDICASCGGVAAGSCFVSNGTPACDDEECCNAVCNIDPFCCDTSWDGQCASGAADLCAASCPGDFNGDGNVNVSDLLHMLGAFGACPGCPEDLNGDGNVNVSDLLALLGVFGPCP